MSTRKRNPRPTIEDKYYMAYLNKKVGIVSQQELAEEFGKSHASVHENISSILDPNYYQWKNKTKKKTAKQHLDNNLRIKATNNHRSRLIMLVLRMHIFLMKRRSLISIFWLST